MYFFFPPDTQNHNCAACTLPVQPPLHQRQRSEEGWGEVGGCREQVSSYQKRRLGVFSAALLETFSCRTLTPPSFCHPAPTASHSRQPRLNNTHTFTAAARLGRSRAARRPTPEPPETHILQPPDELLKTRPAPPCFLHGLELAGCCIVRRPLAWRPGL